VNPWLATSICPSGGLLDVNNYHHHHQKMQANLEAMELKRDRLRNIQSKLILLEPFLRAHFDQDT
jgi:hypothetical protein